jgi:hypothetical protein
MHLELTQPARADDGGLHLCGIAPALDSRGTAYSVSIMVCAAHPGTEKRLARSLASAVNGRADALQALRDARALLDSVAFVANEGDTVQSLARIDAAIRALQGV